MRFLIIALITAALFSWASACSCGSPYAANGIGNTIVDDYGRSRGMGGTGIANGDGVNIRRDNPALIAAFDKYTLSYSIIFDNIKTNMKGRDSEISRKIVPNTIKIVLPVSKYFVVGWGLSPYSKTDTKVMIENTQNAIRIDDKVSSSGGLTVSSTTFAGSYKDIIKFGFSFNYNFGMIQEDWERSFPYNDDFKDSVYYIKRKYKGYSQSIGFLAHITENITFGAGYTTKSDMDLDTYAVTGFINNPENHLSGKTVTLPSNLSFGIYSDFNERVQAGMDIAFVQWKNAAREAVEKEMYNNTYRAGIGIRFIPSTRTRALYIAKLPLSLGLRVGTLYYKSYPKINTISEKMVTFGIELPFKENLGSIVTSFEYGTRGDKNKNGWDENIMSVGIALIGRIK